MPVLQRLYARSSFFIRVKGLQLIRAMQNIIHRPPRLNEGKLDDYPVLLAESVTTLYTSMDSAERPFMLGKIENLRVACQKINKSVLRAGDTFSLWRQLGPPWTVRGYAVGREVREGCIVPTTGGGLCQLSGALMELAGRLKFTIVERHHHTALPPDVRYVSSRDATLFWNYVDLRFTAPVDVLFEAYLTGRELVVCARSRGEQVPLDVPSVEVHNQLPVRNADADDELQRQKLKTAYLLGDPQPELTRHVVNHYQKGDEVFSPTKIYPGVEDVHAPLLYRLRRSATLRWAVLRKQTVAKAHFALAEQLARYYASRLDYRFEHVCIAQTLLPYLWRSGKLAGRSFDVLMYREPITAIELELDAAINIYPHSTTLNEFRSPQWFAEAESEALDAARYVITPHSEVARHYCNVITVPWETMSSNVSASREEGRDIILFPGPTLARKGAYALRESIRATGLPLMITGSSPEGADFWQELPVTHCEVSEIPWSRVRAVVQPALFEYWPRQLLKAHQVGAQLVISPGCGIRENRDNGIWHVPFGDAETLANALMKIIKR